MNDAKQALGHGGALGGLGKLIDNKAYLGNVSQDIQNFKEQHHFIGWESTRRAPVRIEFKFDMSKLLPSEY